MPDNPHIQIILGSTRAQRRGEPIAHRMIHSTKPPRAGTRPGLLARVAAWTMKHKRIVLGGWLLALVIAMAASREAGSHFVNNLSLGGTDSQRAVDLLRRDFPARSGDLDQIVVHTNQGSIRDPAVRARQPARLNVRPLARHSTRKDRHVHQAGDSRAARGQAGARGRPGRLS